MLFRSVFAWSEADAIATGARLVKTMAPEWANHRNIGIDARPSTARDE